MGGAVFSARFLKIFIAAIKIHSNRTQAKRNINVKLKMYICTFSLDIYRNSHGGDFIAYRAYICLYIARYRGFYNCHLEAFFCKKGAILFPLNKIISPF